MRREFPIPTLFRLKKKGNSFIRMAFFSREYVKAIPRLFLKRLERAVFHPKTVIDISCRNEQKIGQPV